MQRGKYALRYPPPQIAQPGDGSLVNAWNTASMPACVAASNAGTGAGGACDDGGAPAAPAPAGGVGGWNANSFGGSTPSSQRTK